MDPRKNISCPWCGTLRPVLSSLPLVSYSPRWTHPLTVSEAAMWLPALFSDSSSPHHLAPPCSPRYHLACLVNTCLFHAYPKCWIFETTAEPTRSQDKKYISSTYWQFLYGSFHCVNIFYLYHSHLILFCLPSLDSELLKAVVLPYSLVCPLHLL